MAAANEVDRAARDPERADKTPPKQDAMVRTALFNAPFLLLLFGIQQSLPAFFQALLVGLVLFIVPGLAWTDRRGRDGFVVVFRMVVWSLLTSLACWLVLVPLPGPTSRLGFLIAIALVTNVGLLLGHKRGWYDPAPFRAPAFRLIGLAASVMFVQSYLGAVHFIPALEDQDMETQGTSYGLIHEISPTFVTDRGTRFFFAHPLLLHFWIGAGALVSDDLDRMRHYHEGSLSVADTSNAPLDATTWRKLLDRAKVDYDLFERDPVLLPTRAPNLFLGALVLFPLGFLVYRLGGSRWVAAGACVLYSTLPEVYVRSAYGGYMGMTNFVTLSGAYFYLEAAGLLPNRDGVEPLPHAPRLAFGAGLLSAWANQKAALIPAAAGLHAGLRLLADGGVKDLIRRARANPALTTAILIGIGFVLGWLTFAAYGLVVSPRDFILDHVKNHIVRRLKMSDVKLIEQPTQGWYYLSIVGLWRQFAQHHGWLLMAAAVPAMVRAARRWREAEGFFLLWFAFGAVGFSLVDWRQTKHLAKLLPPLIVLTGVLWASLAGRMKSVMTVLLAGALAVNVYNTLRLMADFEYIRPVPIW